MDPLDDAGRELVERNYSLIGKLYGKYYSLQAFISKDDIQSALAEALVRAACRWPAYCAENNYSADDLHFFPAYAVRRMKGAVTDLMRDLDSVSRTVRTRLKDSGGTISDLPAADKNRVPLLLEEVQWSNLDDRKPSTESDVQAKEMLQTVVDSIHQLPWEQQVILALYWYKEMKFKDIAPLIGRHSESVSELNNEAILAVREALLSQATLNARTGLRPPVVAKVPIEGSEPVTPVCTRRREDGPPTVPNVGAVASDVNG